MASGIRHIAGRYSRGGLWSVSVGAASRAQAEAAAKVACILGPHGGMDVLRAQGLPGLLVEENGAWHTTGGWPIPAGEL